MFTTVHNGRKKTNDITTTTTISGYEKKNRKFAYNFD